MHTFYSDRVGKRNEAALIVTNPQIINGGQTAFTLSRIYEEHLKDEKSLDIFKTKEVLLKVITFDHDEESESTVDPDKLKLIESISMATNNQTEVTEADRRSNDKIQVDLQQNIFKEFGYFYERKKGEFGDGIRFKYIDRTKVVDRETFLRVVISISGNPAQSRRGSAKQIFKVDTFQNILKSPELYKKYFFGFKAYTHLNSIQRTFEKEKNNRYGIAQYGNAVRYGKWAVVYVASDNYKDYKDHSGFESNLLDAATSVIGRWNEFETFAKKEPTNTSYFKEVEDPETGEKTLEINFDNYYKGRTLINDLNNFFEINQDNVS